MNAHLALKMSYKRKNTSSPECENSPKRQCVTDYQSYDGDGDSDASSDNFDERPQISNTTGQSGAFPGLTNGQDGDLFYGPADNGIDYLRMVRSEAMGIPGLLKAPTSNPQVDRRNGQDADEGYENEDDGGYWEDDAFIATPFTAKNEDLHTMPAAQIQYYQSIQALFDLNRAALRRTPPVEAISRLRSSQPISFPASNSRARAVWFEMLCNSDPSPVQIACMDDDSVMEFLRLISERLHDLISVNRIGDADKTRRVGAWLWAVLAKYPGRDVLGAEEICDVRDLAKNAAGIIESLKPESFSEVVNGQSDQGEHVIQHSKKSIDEDLTFDFDAARDRLRQSERDCETLNGVHEVDSGVKLRPKVSEAQPAHISTVSLKMTVLDIILTIVGENYGQRDLLQYRPIWSEPKSQLTKHVRPA